MMSRKILLLLILVLLLQVSILKGAEVGEVVFRQEGDYHFSDDVLKCNVQTKKGLVFSDRMVNEDVRRLYSMGVFSDVVSIIEDMEGGRKRVSFRVVPKPLVTSVKFDGNRKYPDTKLSEFVTVTAGSPQNDKQLSESAEKLRKFYMDEGLSDASVSPVLEQDGQGVRVVFRIRENLRLRVNRVEYEGVTLFPVSELNELLETRHSYLSVNWLSWLPLTGRFGLFDREALDRDKIRLRDHYWKKGYLDFKITEVVTTEDEENPELINVLFKVEEGEPYFVGQIRMKGVRRFTEAELMTAMPFTADSLYTSVQNETFMKSVEARYRPLGYADFNIRCTRHPNFETHTVDLDYDVYEGPPYTIGEVYISGNKWTKDHVIRREILLFPDDPLDQTLIDVTKSRLMGMGYFEGKAKEESGVDILAVNSPDDPGRKKDIHINVREKRFLDAKIGAGWSSDDSLAGMIELSHSNMDILDPAHYFTGGGQRMRIMALAGLEHMGLQADFTEPWLFGIPLRLDISGYWREVSYENWNERRIGFSVSLTKRIFDDFTTISGGYMFEGVRVYEMARKMSSRFQDEVGNDLVGRLFLSLERDTRNSATNPTNGYFVSAFASLTSKGLGASHDYYKIELRGINYYSFLHDWLVLSTGFKIGSTGTFTRDGSVPLYDRYFLGGGDSIRGFPYRSIGPVDENEDNYGGEFMYLFTAELSHPIWEMVRGAVFVDVGSATSGKVGPITSPNVGLGYGLRIKLPHVAVPIRLDLAYPLVCNQEGVSKKLRFHFNMGFSF